MSEKNLTEIEWKKFSKGRDLKDAALVKALAALEKAKAPDQQLTALEDIEKQADVLRKSAKNDKELVSYLDDLDKALDKQRKLSESEAKKAAREAEKKQGDDEEEDSPALLTTMMIPLIRAVKKGDITLQALVAVAGKETVVLLSRRAISPSRGKLLKEQMASPGGLKFIRGECLLELGALTFVVQSQAAGLAKRLRAALLAQTDLRLKVRVRGENPDDLDSDGEDEGEGEGEAPDASVSTSTTTATNSGPDADEAALQRRYAQRFAELEPMVDEALRKGTGDVSKIRIMRDYAQEKADGKLYADGLKTLDRLAQTLALGGAQGGAPNVRFEQATQAWRSTRDGVVARLRVMAKEIADTKDPEASAAIIEVSAVFKQLNADPKTEQQVLELMRWVDNDDVVLDVSEISEDIRTPLMSALQAMQRALQPAA